jgi:hypothetical protein
MIIVTTTKLLLKWQLSHILYHDDDEYHMCQNIKIKTIIIHNKRDDESHSQQNLMIISITILKYFSNGIFISDPILIRNLNQ